MSWPPVFGETKETGRVEMINGIKCAVVKIHFPAESGSSEAAKWRWFNAYRFAVPGWPECTITGLAAARRVIRGRTDPAVINTLGIRSNSNQTERESVIAKLREGKNTTPPREPKHKRRGKDGPEI